MERDSHTSPPLKRQRAEEPQLLESQSRLAGQFQHDKEVWFDDGNFVLVSQTDEVTASPVTFRVHQGILSAHCEVFKNMFATCNSADSESYFGCPVVVLQDSATDLRRVLKAMMFRQSVISYRSSTVCPLTESSNSTYARDLTKLSLCELASIVRLSTKYDFSALREDIVAHLKVLYPTTLDDYQSRS